MDKLCMVIDSNIRRFGVEEEGINLISSMVVSFNNNFSRAADRYWPHVMHGLENIQKEKTFKASLQAVGDYSRVYQEAFVDRIHDIMGRLLVLVKQANITR